MTLAQRPSIWKNSFSILISCRTTQLNHINKYHSDISIKRTMQLTYLRPTLLIEGVPGIRHFPSHVIKFNYIIFLITTGVDVSVSFNYYQCRRVSLLITTSVDVSESFNYYECGRVSEVSGVFAS